MIEQAYLSHRGELWLHIEDFQKDLQIVVEGPSSSFAAAAADT